MNRTDRDHGTGLGISARWLVFAVFVVLFGLCYVHMKQKLTTDGDRCRELEIAVRELDEKIVVADSETRRLTGRPSLERRRQEGFIRMMEVSDSRIVRLRPQTESAALASTHGEGRP